MPSPTRESVLGLYVDCKSTKGEGHLAKTGYFLFPSFAGDYSAICYTALGKKLRFVPDLLKSCSDDIKTGVGVVDDNGRQKSLLVNLTERQPWQVCKLS